MKCEPGILKSDFVPKAVQTTGLRQSATQALPKGTFAAFKLLMLVHIVGS